MSDWKKKLPMQLTLSRVYVLPILLWALWTESFWGSVFAAVMFILASITDYYDGHFARKYQAVSTTGKFMDPVTDKILVTSVLIFLVHLQRVDAYLVILLLIRDTFIGGLRSAAAADQIVIAAKASGKWKTGLQMSAIPAVIIWEFPTGYPQIGQLGYFILWFSVVLSLWSGVEYYKMFKLEMSKKGLPS